jgi:hypothetical protein
LANGQLHAVDLMRTRRKWDFATDTNIQSSGFIPLPFGEELSGIQKPASQSASESQRSLGGIHLSYLAQSGCNINNI